MRDIVPVAELGGRMPEHGRIRAGIKAPNSRGKLIPQAIRTFRFTSPDGEAIEQIAALYGGTARPWADPKANPSQQWEVITTANEIRVFLPPHALSLFYEQWAGGGVLRRCDGITAEVPSSGDDEMIQVPCQCKAQNNLQCKPHARLNVVLPEIRFGGAWRYETKGWHAARELPAMEQMIDALQAVGILEAKLRLEERQSEGGRKQFVVPRLILGVSAQQMLAGAGTTPALGAASDAPALGAGTDTPAPISSTNETPVPRDWFEADDEVIEAEIVVEEPAPDAEVIDLADRAARHAGTTDRAQTKLIMLCAELATRHSLDEDTFRHGLALAASHGRTSSSKELTPEERSKALDVLVGMQEGTYEYLGLKPDRSILVKKR